MSFRCYICCGNSAGPRLGRGWSMYRTVRERDWMSGGGGGGEVGVGTLAHT